MPSFLHYPRRNRSHPNQIGSIQGQDSGDWRQHRPLIPRLKNTTDSGRVGLSVCWADTSNAGICESHDDWEGGLYGKVDGGKGGLEGGELRP